MVKTIDHGVYKTNKTHVVIGETQVTKTFLPSRYYKLRFRRESKALALMSRVDNVPKLIDSDNGKYVLVMSRLAGANPLTLSEDNVKQLRNIVHGMLKSGVARHAIPIRDILVNKEGQLGMVDFERVSLKFWKFSPFWLTACIVTRYHLCRLINGHQPQCLSANEHIVFHCIHFIRALLQPLNNFKKMIFKIFR